MMMDDQKTVISWSGLCLYIIAKDLINVRTKVLHRYETEFLDELDEAGDRLVVVEFTAIWCPKHDAVSSEIQKLMLNPEFAEVIFLQVDVDENGDTPAKYGVDFLPTVQFYKFGEKVAEVYEDTLDRLKAVLQLHR